ncbi:hypothetical protein LCGC14_0351290 [marine sediment metagenome]|uniref:Uncharacterized protein n=1 Tax=marine sediment metagenome TaxID=412755 RepID=A0A0F9TAQ5_9ZZZZ
MATKVKIRDMQLRTAPSFTIADWVTIGIEMIPQDGAESPQGAKFKEQDEDNVTSSSYGDSD